MTSVPPQAPPPPPIPQPPKPDLTMAWLPHLLLLFTYFIGPLIIWLTQKDANKLGAFHGKQALFWSIGVCVVVIGLYILIFAFAIVAGPLAFLPICAIWVLLLGNFVYVIYAIVQTAQGKPFKYFFVADKFCAKEFQEAYPSGV
jgi:hypothetical protein